MLGAMALLLLVAAAAAPAASQTSGTPVVTLTHEYIITEFGFGILNDTFTFQNNGTSSLQVPSFQLGIPDTVASHAVTYIVEPASGYSISHADNGTLTTVSVTPTSPSLAAGAKTSVVVETYLSDVLNITAGSATPFGADLLLSPSTSLQLNTLNLIVQLPDGGSLSPAPKGFIPSLSTSPPTYSVTDKNTTATASVQWSKLKASDQAFFLPVRVTSVVATVIPGSGGQPQVQDLVTLRNLANYSISDLPLSLLSSSVSTVTVVPWSTTPTINPTIVTLTNGALALTSAPFTAAIQGGDNFTFALQYAVPASMVKTSGSTVTVSLPYILPIEGVVDDYTVQVQLQSGIHAVGPASTSVANATPINQGTVGVSYSVSPGWAADQAIPAAALVFAACFVAVALRRPEAKDEEEAEEEERKTATDMLPDLIQGLEDKIALFSQFQTQIAGKSQGSVQRAEFSKVRNEVDALKTRANNRINEIRQTAGSKRFIDLLNQMQDAEREEDRAAKDLLNLYDQYHGKRMREDTFRRLLQSYKKRWDAATNRLSDLINLAQREGKQT
jgi:hypothetical protein